MIIKQNNGILGISCEFERRLNNKPPSPSGCACNICPYSRNKICEYAEQYLQEEKQAARKKLSLHFAKLAENQRRLKNGLDKIN